MKLVQQVLLEGLGKATTCWWLICECLQVQNQLSVRPSCSLNASAPKAAGRYLSTQGGAILDEPWCTLCHCGFAHPQATGELLEIIADARVHARWHSRDAA
eukprot:6359325-Amphidinium_carterae.1